MKLTNEEFELLKAGILKILKEIFQVEQKEDTEAWREECLKKQAAGVRFEFNDGSAINPRWDGGCGGATYNFTGNKEDYREVPQEVSIVDEFNKHVIEPLLKDCLDRLLKLDAEKVTPHAAERALWKAQRDAGTNEVWQAFSRLSKTWCDLDNEPKWYSDTEYRVKPMKLTARIVSNKPVTPEELQKTKVQDWEFYGTREEYRAECEKYGYAVVSEIKEVVEKPKTVKYYFCLYKHRSGSVTTIDGYSEKWINEWVADNGIAIIGDIEEREVPIG